MAEPASKTSYLCPVCEKKPGLKDFSIDTEHAVVFTCSTDCMTEFDESKFTAPEPEAVYNFFLVDPDYANSQDEQEYPPLFVNVMQMSKKNLSNVTFAYPYATTRMPLEKIPYYYASTVKLNNFLFMLAGGLDQNFQEQGAFAAMKACFLIQLVSIEGSEYGWEPISLPEFKKARYCHKLLVAGNFVYAIGGIHKAKEGSTEFLSHCECLNIKNLAKNLETQTYPLLGEGEWMSMPPMHKKRSQLSAFTYKNMLYAIGGYSASGVVENSVERYNESKDVWELFEFKANSTVKDSSKLFLASSLCLGNEKDDKFYLLGGSDGKKKYNTVYALDMNKTEADEICTLKNNRANSLGFIDGADLIVFGGEQKDVIIEKITTTDKEPKAQAFPLNNPIDSSFLQATTGISF